MSCLGSGSCTGVFFCACCFFCVGKHYTQSSYSQKAKDKQLCTWKSLRNIFIMHTLLLQSSLSAYLFLLQTSSREELLTVLMSCDIIVYHIVDDVSQVEQASWAIQGLHCIIHPHSEYLVLLSLSPSSSSSRPVVSLFIAESLCLCVFSSHLGSQQAT